MAVSTVDAGVVRLGDNVTTEFSFNFKVSRAEDIRVANLVEQSIVPLDPGQYSVMLNPGNVGGEVTLSSAPLIGDRIYIYRETNLEQLVEVSSQTKYDPVVVEGVWDKLTLIAQELNAKAERAVKTVPGENPDLLVDAISASVVSAQGAASQAAASESAAAASAAAADADAAQTAADRTQTGLDAAATAADRIQTGLDRTQTGLDRAAAEAASANADTKAAQAATSAGNANTSATNALTHAQNAGTQAEVATTKADEAATSAAAAATSETNAAASAAAAAASAGSMVKATQAQAEAGADDTAYMTALKSKQQVDARVATQAEAEAGTNNTKLMTPLRVEEHMLANGLGWGQTWQNFTGSRSKTTVYQNTTGKPIMVRVEIGDNVAVQVSVDNSTWVDIHASEADGAFAGPAFIVPNNHYYRLTGSGTLRRWVELR